MDTSPLDRLKRRADFLRVAGRRRKWVTPGLIVQAADQDGSGYDGGGVRCGFTASRKVGGAVARNRAKRRLRALAREIMPDLASVGHDYVLIARSETVDRPYDLLISDLKTALTRLKVTRLSRAPRSQDSKQDRGRPQDGKQDSRNGQSEGIGALPSARVENETS